MAILLCVLIAHHGVGGKKGTRTALSLTYEKRQGRIQMNVHISEEHASSKPYGALDHQHGWDLARSVWLIRPHS